jgi:hypothetical protein
MDDIVRLYGGDISKMITEHVDPNNEGYICDTQYVDIDEAKSVDECKRIFQKFCEQYDQLTTELNLLEGTLQLLEKGTIGDADGTMHKTVLDKIEKKSHVVLMLDLRYIELKRKMKKIEHYPYIGIKARLIKRIEEHKMRSQS